MIRNDAWNGKEEIRNHCMQEYYFEILPATGVKRGFTYKYDLELALGELVLVPFQNREILGVVTEKVVVKPEYETKPILRNYELCFDSDLLKFLDFVASYNLIAKGLVLKMFLSPRQALTEEERVSYLSLLDVEAVKVTEKRAKVIKYLAECGAASLKQIKNDTGISSAICADLLKKGALKSKIYFGFIRYPEKLYVYEEPNLSEMQDGAWKELKKLLPQNKFNVALLNGITGSGKTEVYLKLIADFLELSEKQILLLLPEIILTKQFIDKFAERFGRNPDFFHSNTSNKQKKEIWHGAISGKARIIIGARSALFLPFKDLGLIIIDEEHDGSYKQEEMGCYHARDMAIARAKISSLPVLLASATPSIETVSNCLDGKYSEVKLDARYNEASLPEISMVNMKNEILKKGNFISDSLREKIKEKLKNDEQVLLYLNRLGFSPLVICGDCGFRFACTNCDVWLSYHKSKGMLLCHHCGYAMPKPVKCPKCVSDKLVSCGPGVERIAHEVCEVFPGVKSQVITSEIMNKTKELYEIIEAIKNNEIQILIGTQILAKGHHFPDLTLVGVIDSDVGGNNLEDFKAAEKLFQILQQVAGRAGRSEKKGEVLMQTYFPERKFFKYLQKHNYTDFSLSEIKQRRLAHTPPFSRIASLVFSGYDANETRRYAQDIRDSLPNFGDIDVLGPIPSEISYLRKRFRFRLNFRASTPQVLQRYIQEYILRKKLSNTVRIKIDIDPQSFY